MSQPMGKIMGMIKLSKMNEPKIVLEKFLKYWEKEKWEEMIKYVELNWLGYDWEGKPDLIPNCMKALFGWKELKRWKIIEMIEKKSEKISYLVLITYLFYGKIKVRKIKVMVSFQSDFINKSKQRWGINPISCLEEYNLEGEKAWK